MKSALFGLLIALQFSAFAHASSGMPKKTTVITDIGASPVDVTLSEINLDKLSGKCVNHEYMGTKVTWMEQVNFNQKITLQVGHETYESVEGGYIVYNYGSSNCVQNVSDLSMVRVFLFHSEFKNQMLTLDLMMPEKVMVLKSQSGLAVHGTVLEVY